MSWPKPKFSKSKVNRAGEILALDGESHQEAGWAHKVLINWRACHGYPINTFQATLRNRLKSIDKKAIVAQRLKRTPSIVSKLRRFSAMKLSRMHDIGGLRAVVGTLHQVRTLEALYNNGRLRHELHKVYDYIKEPKSDGYRSVHLVFKYKNDRAHEYKGLLVELQLRTKIQHAWATAVET
ncbi:MAG: RelA/SpoT domain-containing protein, partial [Chloroflexota bacterium]